MRTTASRMAARSVALVVLAAIALAGSARAQSVSMSGGMGSKALLVINGSAPKALGAGDVHMGVKVLGVSADQAVVEVAGKRQTVLLGGAPVNLGGASSGGTGTSIVLTAGSGGHFIAPGTINGKAVEFLVDTGATSVSMGADDARRMGIKLDDSQRFQGMTANGVVVGWRVKLDSVRIRDVEVFNVEGAVLPGSMSHVLLGNSFLTRFQMRRDNDQLTLTRR